jgi:hypothetical protein
MRALQRVFRGRRPSAPPRNFNAIVSGLFRNGEQGFAYNHNLSPTMWQDIGQTVPVTGPDQPIGFQFDVSGRGNHRFQSAAASRPMLRYNAATGSYYLQYDGINTFLVTNSIDFSGTGSVSLFAGVRKLSDSATGVVCELGTNIGANTFLLLAPAGNGANSFRWQPQSGGINQIEVGNIYPAPVSAVLTGVVDKSTNFGRFFISGSEVLPPVGFLVSGTFGNHPMYFGRRAGTTFPFNGHEYSPICVGRLTTASEIANINRMLAQRTGGTLA